MKRFAWGLAHSEGFAGFNCQAPEASAPPTSLADIRVCLSGQQLRLRSPEALRLPGAGSDLSTPARLPEHTANARPSRPAPCWRPASRLSRRPRIEGTRAVWVRPGTIWCRSALSMGRCWHLPRRAPTPTSPTPWRAHDTGNAHAL